MKYLQNKYLKLVVAALIVVWAVYQFVQGNIGNGIALILLSLFPVLLYFRNEFILLTFLRLRKQDFEGMEKWLSKIADPETALLRKQQGYYNYMYGVIFPDCLDNDGLHGRKKYSACDTLQYSGKNQRFNVPRESRE